MMTQTVHSRHLTETKAFLSVSATPPPPDHFTNFDLIKLD